MALDTVDFHASVTLNATPERLWPLISDTSRVNQLIGLPPSKRVEPGDHQLQTIHSHYYGVPVTWHELPFQWVFEQWFESERAFFEPIPVHRVMTVTRLTAIDERRTQVDVRVRLTNRNPLGWLASNLLVGRQMLRDLVRVYRSFEATAIAASKVPPPPHRLPVVKQAQLERGAERLRQLDLDPALVAQLETHLRSTADADVLKMRPFELAEQWGVDGREVLRLCLYATRSGLLDLEWDVLCPNCRGANMRAPRLGDLLDEVHCPACNIRYDLNFDESVELRFSVSPAVREAIDLSYCIGGPANTRHILAQLRVAKHSTQHVQLRIPAGTYRFRSLQHSGAALLEAHAEVAQRATTIRIAEAEITVDTPHVAPGICQLAIENQSDNDVLLILENRAWSRNAASAATVTALDEFRQLFSSEVLAPGLGLSVRSLTFLFSDLKDSTTIYDSIGDAPAYARVRDHFAVMRAIIVRYRGALVKTIGDAVMAVFASSEDAVAAALEMQHEFIAGEIAQGRPALQVKLGLHCGPCIAVNANDLLDYFGSTVNVAARVQNESRGGDLVLTDALMSDPDVRRVVARVAPEIEQFERALKGVNQRYTLYRLLPRMFTTSVALAHVVEQI